MKALIERPDLPLRPPAAGALLFRTICLASLLALAACGSDDDDTTAAPEGQAGEPGEQGSDAGAPPDGLRLLSSGGGRSVEEAIGEVEAAIAGNGAVSVVRIIDHAAGAESIGETLPPTSVILFGNPALGTPLMERSRTAGLDLPQKILAYQDADGELEIAWNTSDWLAARHGIDPATPELATIADALEGLAMRAAGTSSGETDGAAQEGADADEGGADAGAPDEAGADGAVADGADAAPMVAPGEGIVTVTSANDFETTYAALVAAIQADGPPDLLVELDHAANAASVGLELPPTRLVVFGNPALGTPLMQSARSVAIDLPQRMLVREGEDGAVSIAYNDPAWVAGRHGITDRSEQVETITGALAALAAGAAAEGGGN